MTFGIAHIVWCMDIGQSNKPQGAQAPSFNLKGELKMREIDDSEAEEIKAEARHLRRYQYLLSQHPDCRDPEHPTCELCEENDDDN